MRNDPQRLAKIPITLVSEPNKSRYQKTIQTLKQIEIKDAPKGTAHDKKTTPAVNEIVISGGGSVPVMNDHFSNVFRPQVSGRQRRSVVMSAIQGSIETATN